MRDYVIKSVKQAIVEEDDKSYRFQLSLITEKDFKAIKKLLSKK
jgi:hypothetical protein